MLEALLRALGLGPREPEAEEGAAFEKRRAPRLSTRLPCEVYDLSRSRLRGEAVIRNISFHGVCLDTDFAIRPGDEFLLSFSLSNSRFELVRAKAMWSSKLASTWRSGLSLDEKRGKEIRPALLQLLSRQA